MSGAGDGDPGAIPVFSSEDVVRLFTATYLPLCRTLGATGVLDTQALAREIADRAAAEDGASWSSLAKALATVLENDAKRS